MPHRHLHHRRQHEQHDDGSNSQSSADIARQVAQDAESVANVATVVSVQFVTASKTFSGLAAGYTTLFPASQSTPTDSLTPIQSSQAAATPAQLISTLAGQSAETPLSSAVPTSIVAPDSSTPLIAVSSDNTLGQTTSAAISATTDTAITDSTSLLSSMLVTASTGAIVNASPTINGLSTSTEAIAASATETSSSAKGPITNQSSKGLTGGAKAGIAIGVILALAALLALLAFCYRRRKNHQREAYGRAEDEKNPFGDNAATPVPAFAPVPASTPASTPPQLSLRPASQFHPEFAGQQRTVNATAISPNQGLDEARNMGGHINPFDDAPSLTHQILGVRDPILAQQEIPAPLRIRTPTPELTVEAGLVAGATSAIIAQRHNAPKPLDIKRSLSPTPSRVTEGTASSPAVTEFSMNSVSPGSMTNGAPPLTNVHRIQLDFKPSMEDELELRAGQLVRLLHEYDDGWALCIRLDRSQQGVAPRTCLSTRPVKPRSKPQPRGPATGPRGPPMLGSMSSASGSSSPASLRAPHSVSPAPIRSQQRSMSPGPYGGGPQQKSISTQGGRRRSNSVSDLREGRNGPPGPSLMNPDARATREGQQRVPMPAQVMTAPARKPVPLQTT